VNLEKSLPAGSCDLRWISMLAGWGAGETAGVTQW
jgi:hypothetical protein